jgi:ABC transporter ATM
LDGEDVRNLKSESLRGAVAVVPQDTILFNDTILHNVTYGRPGSTAEEVRAATSAAKLDAAVNRMPEKWETLVGERGLKLSGGEKQRVAIARAFLREPRLLICDEATSALDSATERGIMESLKELAAGRTSVFVAHRLSTVQGCDKIYVLKDGKVAEEGTHAELMLRNGGVYREMWKMQAAQQALDKKAGVVQNDEEGIERGGEKILLKKSGGEGTAVGAVIEGVVDIIEGDSSDESSAELDVEAAAIERSL